MFCEIRFCGRLKKYVIKFSIKSNCTISAKITLKYHLICLKIYLMCTYVVDVFILIPELHCIAIKWHIIPPLKTDDFWVFLTYFFRRSGNISINNFWHAWRYRHTHVVYTIYTYRCLVFTISAVYIWLSTIELNSESWNHFMGTSSISRSIPTNCFRDTLWNSMRLTWKSAAKVTTDS